MKKYMLTEETLNVPFLDTEDIDNKKWRDIVKAGDLSLYIGKTLLNSEGKAAYYVTDSTHYITFTITEVNK